MIIFSNLLISVQVGGGWGPSQHLRMQGGSQTQTEPLSIAEPLTPPLNSDWDSVDTPVHLTCTSLGCGRELEHSEKTHADMSRRCQPTPHTQWPLPGIDFIFSCECYNDISFKDLITQGLGSMRTCLLDTLPLADLGLCFLFFVLQCYENLSSDFSLLWQINAHLSALVIPVTISSFTWFLPSCQLIKAFFFGRCNIGL